MQKPVHSEVIKTHLDAGRRIGHLVHTKLVKALKLGGWCWVFPSE
jgi:hypothetical protein